MGGLIGVRDNVFRNIIAEEANYAGFTAQKEIKDLVKDNNAKPADILITEFIKGKDTVIDTTIGHALVNYHNKDKSNMQILEEKKIIKYNEMIKFEERNLEFIVCAMTTFGGMNKGTLKVIDRIAESRSKISLITKDEIKKEIINKITTKVFKKVAEQITNH